MEVLYQGRYAAPDVFCGYQEYDCDIWPLQCPNLRWTWETNLKKYFNLYVDNSFFLYIVWNKFSNFFDTYHFI